MLSPFFFFKLHDVSGLRNQCPGVAPILRTWSFFPSTLETPGSETVKLLTLWARSLVSIQPKWCHHKAAPPLSPAELLKPKSPHPGTSLGFELLEFHTSLSVRKPLPAGQGRLARPTKRICRHVCGPVPPAIKKLPWTGSSHLQLTLPFLITPKLKACDGFNCLKYVSGTNFKNHLCK